MKPSDAVAGEDVAAAAANAGAAEGADVEGVPMGGPSGPSKTPSGMLLHAEPAIPTGQAKSELGVEDAGAHLYVAARKALDYVSSSETGGSGLPMVGNLIAAGYHVVTGQQRGDGGDVVDKEVGIVE